MRPGEVIAAPAGTVPRLEGGERATVEVTNRGPLPVQVGAYMRFDRLSRELECRPEPRAGARLLLPAGTSVRIEPGRTVEVEAVWN